MLSEVGQSPKALPVGCYWLQSMRGSPLSPLLQNRACKFPRTRLLSY